jgi:hypothetical protein
MVGRYKSGCRGIKAWRCRLDSAIFRVNLSGVTFFKERIYWPDECFFTNTMVCSEQHTGPQVRSRTKCSCGYMNYTQQDKRTEEQQRLFHYSTNESLTHWKLIVTWHSLSTILRRRHEELSERQMFLSTAEMWKVKLWWLSTKMGNYFVLEKRSWWAESKESEKRQYLASLFFSVRNFRTWTSLVMQ